MASVNEFMAAGSSSRNALILRFICLCLIIPAAGFASHWMVIRLSAKSASRLRARLSHQILSTPLRTLEELGAHRIVATLAEDIPAVTAAIAYVPLLLTQFVMIAGSLAYLGWLSRPLLALF